MINPIMDTRPSTSASLRDHLASASKPIDGFVLLHGGEEQTRSLCFLMKFLWTQQIEQANQSKKPLPLSVGYIAQYVLKPLLGLLIARAFRMPPIFFAGFVLTSCIAEAQLSCYASYLSKGDVALSILLTSSTTISSVLVTSLLTGLLIGSVVPVNAVVMSKSILQAEHPSEDIKV